MHRLAMSCHDEGFAEAERADQSEIGKLAAKHELRGSQDVHDDEQDDAGKSGRT